MMNYELLHRCLVEKSLCLEWQTPAGEIKFGGICAVIPPNTSPYDISLWLNYLPKKFIHFRYNPRPKRPANLSRVLIETYYNPTKIGINCQLHYYCPSLNTLFRQMAIVFLDHETVITNLELQAMIELGQLDASWAKLLSEWLKVDIPLMK